MPSLSELSAIYTQRPYAPAQDTNAQLGAGFQQLGGAIEYGREQARQNAPVSPWQEAVMRLMAGHDPKMVANDTKAKLGGMRGNTPIPAGPPQSAAMPPGQASGGQPSLGSAVSDSYGQTGSQRPSQAPTPFVSAPGSRMSNLSAATQPSEAPGDIFGGVNTNRDFHDYMNAMNMVRSHQPRQERDYLGEIALRNSGQQQVAQTQAGAKIESAEIGAGAKKEATAAKAESDKNKLAENKRNHDMQMKAKKDMLDYLYSKLKYADEWHKNQSGKDPVLDAKIKMAQAAVGVFKAQSAQPLEVLTPQGRAQIEASKKEAEMRVKEVDDHISKKHSEALSTNEGGHSSMSGSVRAYKNKKTGQVINATEEQFKSAKNINPADWE